MTLTVNQIEEIKVKFQNTCRGNSFSLPLVKFWCNDNTGGWAYGQLLSKGRKVSQVVYKGAVHRIKNDDVTDV